MKDNLKRIVAIILVVANVICSSGFYVLANSVGSMVLDATINGREIKNYYYLYQEEQIEYELLESRQIEDTKDESYDDSDFAVDKEEIDNSIEENTTAQDIEEDDDIEENNAIEDEIEDEIEESQSEEETEPEIDVNDIEEFEESVDVTETVEIEVTEEIKDEEEIKKIVGS